MSQIMMYCYLDSCRPAVPSRLQLAELEQLLAASDALSFMADSAGARPVHTVRNAIQLQCKTFLEDMHTHSLIQLTGKCQASMKMLLTTMRLRLHMLEAS